MLNVFFDTDVIDDTLLGAELNPRVPQKITIGRKASTCSVASSVGSSTASSITSRSQSSTEMALKGPRRYLESSDSPSRHSSLTTSCRFTLEPPSPGPQKEIQRTKPQSEARQTEQTTVSSSDVSQNFKNPLPVGPVSNQQNCHMSDICEESQDSARPGTIYLHSWRPTLINNKLYVEGEIIDLDNTAVSSSGTVPRYRSSKIVRRIQSQRVASKRRTYILEGRLVLDPSETEISVPWFIIDKFSNGFPENWEKLQKHWIVMERKKKQNHSRMLLFSSTVLSNYSVMGKTLGSNLSIIPEHPANHLVINQSNQANRSSQILQPQPSKSNQSNHSDHSKESNQSRKSNNNNKHSNSTENDQSKESNNSKEANQSKISSTSKENNQSNEINQVNQGSQSDQSNQQSVEYAKPVDGPSLYCDLCNFKAKTERGLKIHTTRKHGRKD